MLTVAAWIVGALGLIAAVAAAWVTVKAAGHMQAAKIWREEAEAQKARSDRLEGDIADLRSEFAEHRRVTGERIGKLEIENARLAELATGKQELIALTELVNLHHGEIMGVLAQKSQPHVVVK